MVNGCGAHVGNRCWRCTKPGCMKILGSQAGARYHRTHGCLDKRLREQAGSVAGVLMLTCTSSREARIICTHAWCASRSRTYTHQPGMACRCRRGCPPCLPRQEAAGRSRMCSRCVRLVGRTPQAMRGQDVWKYTTFQIWAGIYLPDACRPVRRAMGPHPI